MAEPVKIRRKFGRFEYDPVSGTYVLAALVLVAVVLGSLAYNGQGSPQMDNKASVEQGATIPHPSQLSPPPATTGSGAVR
jgi:hypothetical protein